jgi:hypothetical protein
MTAAPAWPLTENPREGAGPTETWLACPRANIIAFMPDKNKLVVVDTNCLVRLYFSPLRPILGRPVAGYELRTLRELAEELKALAAGDRHAWLTDSVIQSEVDGAVHELTRAQTKTINDEAPAIRRTGDASLRQYCQQNNIGRSRTLSLNDAKALTAALELQAALATDEWPLRRVAALYDDDAGNPVELLSSVDFKAHIDPTLLRAQKRRCDRGTCEAVRQHA